MNYKTDCPICGCHGVRWNSKDEFGYEYSECAICEGCENIHDLAFKLGLPAYLKELYLDGVRKERELIEILVDKLAENKMIPTGDLERLAQDVVDVVYDEVKVEAETELQEGLEDWREMMDAAAGRY